MEQESGDGEAKRFGFEEAERAAGDPISEAAVASKISDDASESNYKWKPCLEEAKISCGRSWEIAYAKISDDANDQRVIMADALTSDLEALRHLRTTIKTPQLLSQLDSLIRDWEEHLRPPVPPPATTNPALDLDSDEPDNPTHEFAQFGAGGFWGVELAFQRVVGVVKTEVGFSQGQVHDPNFQMVCSENTKHALVVRVQFDPEVCPYSSLLSLFWSIPDLIHPYFEASDVGEKYRSGIYYYNETQCRLAEESKEVRQKLKKDTETVTEILPAKRFYRAEENHQQFLEKGGCRGRKQSAQKGCSDLIRWYG